MHRIVLHAAGRNVIVFLLCFSILPGWLASEPQRVTVKGDAVAISSSPGMRMILNGVVHTEIILRVDAPEYLASEFVRVSLSVPGEQFDNWMKSLSAVRRFRLKSLRKEDGLLIRSVPLISIDSGEELERIPAWTPLSGHEKVRLPFDEPVMAFESVDWPPVPIL